MLSIFVFYTRIITQEEWNSFCLVYTLIWNELFISSSYLLKYLKIINNLLLSGKFVPMLKENWNAEDLNFSTHLLNYIG